MRCCTICGSNTTRKQCHGKYDDWRYIDSKVVCKDCWAKNYRNNSRRFREIRFCGRIIALSFKIKTGVCSECGQQRTTQIHHYNGYWITLPWFGTIELCIPCHSKTIKREKKGFYSK